MLPSLVLSRETRMWCSYAVTLSGLWGLVLWLCGAYGGIYAWWRGQLKSACSSLSRQCTWYCCGFWSIVVRRGMALVANNVDCCACRWAITDFCTLYYGKFVSVGVTSFWAKCGSVSVLVLLFCLNKVGIRLFRNLFVLMLLQKWLK